MDCLVLGHTRCDVSTLLLMEGCGGTQGGGGAGEDALYKKECPSLGARAASEGTPDLTSDPVM